MNRINKKLFIVIVVAIILRFYRLGDVPSSVNWDEAALGYNAYSISQTLTDEHGVFLPIQYFASFGDYKPPVYIYSAVPFIKLFGLSNFAVRFPSALFGVLTVLMTYFLTKELLRNNSLENLTFSRYKINIPLLSSFFLAISPWALQISRGAFEANLASFWVVTGFTFFLKALNTKRLKYLAISSICLVVSLYTFNSPRLFLPIFLFLIAIIYRKELLSMKKWVFISAVVGVVLLAPLTPHLFSKEGQLRFNEVTIFTDFDVIKTSNSRAEVDENSLLAKTIHNRRVEYALLFAKHYFDHFDPGFLFISGDINPKFSTRDTGQLYLIDLPLILAGVYFLTRNKPKHLMFLTLWFIVAFIPAGTARETPHALRSLLVLPTFQIISAVGFVCLLQKRKILSIIFASLLLVQLLYFQHNYYAHYPKEFSEDWQYGYKDMVPFVLSIKNNYDKVWVSSEYGRPYIFFLYYGKIAPQEFWKDKDLISKDNFGFYHVSGFDKFFFGYATNIGSKGKFLFVGTPNDMPSGTNIINEFHFLDGRTSFLAGELIR